MKPGLGYAGLLIALLLAGCSTAAPSPSVGSVHFGSAVNKDTLTLIGPQKSAFAQTDRLAYVATLSEPANAASLRWVIAKVGASSAETLLVDQSLPISNPVFQVLANEIEMTALMPFLDGPGSYVMRFLRDATVLAEGSFTIT